MDEIPEGVSVIEIGLDVTLCIRVGEGVIAVRIEPQDAPGWFRVRRGPDSLAVHRAEEEKIQPDQLSAPWEWADLGNTGLQVKVTQWPAAEFPDVPVGDIRIGVRRLEDVDA